MNSLFWPCIVIMLVIILGFTYLQSALKKDIFIGRLSFECRDVKLSIDTKEKKKSETSLGSKSHSNPLKKDQ